MLDMIFFDVIIALLFVQFVHVVINFLLFFVGYLYFFLIPFVYEVIFLPLPIVPHQVKFYFFFLYLFDFPYLLLQLNVLLLPFLYLSFLIHSTYLYLLDIRYA